MNEEKFKELDDAYIAYNNDDIDTAIELYESAANSGSVLAIIQLIYIYIVIIAMAIIVLIFGKIK